MTRKQAISQAIFILSNNEENVNIVEKLNEILEELPCAAWTKNSITDAIENYAIEHDNTLPYAHDLTSEHNLPSNTVIYNKFGINSIQEFYERYFPHHKVKNERKSPYENFSQSDFLKIFKNNYIRIKQVFHVKNVTMQMYNMNRKKNEPRLETIIKNCKCNNYNELLFLAGFKKIYKNLEANMSVSYNDDENDGLGELLKK